MPRPINAITGDIIAAAVEVHRHLGPGLLHSAYLLSLAHELTSRTIPHRLDVTLPLVYKGLQVDRGYAVDLLVDESVLVSVKSVDKVLPIHSAQLMTMLKLSGRRAGMIINFNCENVAENVSSIILQTVAGR